MPAALTSQCSVPPLCTERVVGTTTRAPDWSAPIGRPSHVASSPTLRTEKSSGTQARRLSSRPSSAAPSYPFSSGTLSTVAWACCMLHGVGRWRDQRCSGRGCSRIYGRVACRLQLQLYTSRRIFHRCCIMFHLPRRCCIMLHVYVQYDSREAHFEDPVRKQRVCGRSAVGLAFLQIVMASVHRTCVNVVEKF